jgi:prepilin-type N-terminal cleavage/methylation domain-containing protein
MELTRQLSRAGLPAARLHFAGVTGDVRPSEAGFTLVEVIVALGVVVIGFLGAYATVLQSGKLASAAEEEGLVCSGLEQRIDQLRELTWPQLTDGTGVTGQVWTARPEPMAGITVTEETLTISPYDLTTAKTLQAVWTGVAAPTISFTAGADALSAAAAVKVVATLTWTGRRSQRAQTRSLVTVISRGGISKSDL